MSLRKLVLAAILCAAPTAARADVALGLFIGEPTAFDVKLGLDRRSALDLAIGISSLPRNYGDYLHVTYLLTPFVSEGRSVWVPFRIGIGVALFDDGVSFGDGIAVAARIPFEIGLRFRRTPLEIYGELTPMLVFVDPGRTVYFDLDGGVGLRVYL